MLERGRLVLVGLAAGILASLAVAQWIGRITPGAGLPSLMVWLAARCCWPAPWWLRA